MGEQSAIVSGVFQKMRLQRTRAERLHYFDTFFESFKFPFKKAHLVAHVLSCIVSNGMV